MANRVFVHIGSPKAGTTYLQTVLWSNRESLAKHGLLLPGAARFDHNRIAWTVRSDRPDTETMQDWDRFNRQIRDWSGDVLISNEWISMASEPRARWMVEQLQPSEVHVVFTARSFVGAATSSWQQTMKAGLSQSIDAFLESLDAGSGYPGARAEPHEQHDPRWTWANLDPALALARWANAVPPERIHVVTVPARAGQPDLLWKRFAATCGIDPDSCDLSTGKGNDSLGVESARLMQQIGPRLREAARSAAGRSPVPPHVWVRINVGDRLLVPLGGRKVGLREAQVVHLQEKARTSTETLQRAGYDVVGDLADLTLNTLPAGAVHPDDVDDQAVADRSTELLAALTSRLREESRRADRNAKRARGPQPPANAAPSGAIPRRARRLARRVADRLARVR